jgi:amino acid transporter
MNISILGVVPWREMAQAGASSSKLYVVSTFMQRTIGQRAGAVVSVLIMWTAFASVFSLMLGYSRVPYAAAADGNYFKAFARVHPKHKFPYVSLLALALRVVVPEGPGTIVLAVPRGGVEVGAA